MELNFDNSMHSLDAQEVFLEWSRNNNLNEIENHLSSSSSKGEILNYRGEDDAYDSFDMLGTVLKFGFMCEKDWKSAIMDGLHST